MANPFGGLMPFARNNSDALLRTGIGLISGQTGQQQAMLGLSGFADARKDARTRMLEEQQKNMTYQALAKIDPQAAELFKSGVIDGKTAGNYVLQAQMPKDRKNPYMNAGDGRFLNWQTGEFIGDPEGGQAKPLSSVGKINSDFEAGLIDQATRDALIKKAAQSEGMEIISDGKGGFTIRQGALGDKPAKMTESQAKANIYASRMEQSDQILRQLEQQGVDFRQTLTSGVPVVGNYGVSPEYRQYEQAQRDFINATLRQESGAVISPDEFENGKRQYFPQPGDDPATIEQKRRNRETAIRAIREASGKAPQMEDYGGANKTQTGVQWSIEPQ